MSLREQMMIGAAVAIAAVEAVLASHGLWPVARIIGYWLGGILLSFVIAYAATRRNFSHARFAKFFFWTAVAGLVLSWL